MSVIENPIIRGFNPDPSIVVVGDDYYIATSTFEWFPGVQIHHSKDLVNWELIAHPLTMIDLRGVPDSCGVWAPCLSYHEGTFYLVFSTVRSFDSVFKDTPNFLITADDINGPWSDPVFLGSSGFDGSLFHDHDGRKWYLSMLVDHRHGKFFGGIVMQEYSDRQGELVGPVHHIFEGTELGKTEGPHLYKVDNYYYLITAEGGTEYGHAVSIARSRSITGPYEVHPDNPLVSSAQDSGAALQKTGHGDMFQAVDGQWYIVFLVGRPVSGTDRCMLGRETAIEQLVWEEEWPRLAGGGRVPRKDIEIENVEQRAFETAEVIQFEDSTLSVNYQSLRIPSSIDWISYGARPGYLRLYGRDSLGSTFDQSLMARRMQHMNGSYAACLEFDPASFQQMSGIVCYYNTGHFFYLNVSGGSDGKPCLNLIWADNFAHHEALDSPVQLTSATEVRLKVVWDAWDFKFYYAQGDADWIQVGEIYDGSILSDDYVRDGSDRYRPAFTGTFVGICCQDLTGGKAHADFRWVEYLGNG